MRHSPVFTAKVPFYSNQHVRMSTGIYFLMAEQQVIFLFDLKCRERFFNPRKPQTYYPGIVLTTDRTPCLLPILSLN